MKKKFESQGLKFTVKVKQAVDSGCRKCAFRDYGILCCDAPECTEVYFVVTKIKQAER